MLKNIKEYGEYLFRSEKSTATVRKYLNDVGRFLAFVGDGEVSAEQARAYKEELSRKYSPQSVNCAIASLNSFFKFCGRAELCQKRLRVQRRVYCPEERELCREEYFRLVKEAEKRKNERLALLLQTICATGIRVSELGFITVESLAHGEATVNCKGKLRRVLIVKELRKRLAAYAKKRGIVSGSIFITRSGNPLDRSNIWREMHTLCTAARVSEKKVFPHNLRHLFAKMFYSIDKDISRLSDILGHSSIDTTRIYIIESGAEHRKKMENMRLLI